jgi:hypothetical protein
VNSDALEGYTIPANSSLGKKNNMKEKRWEDYGAGVFLLIMSRNMWM